MPSGKKLFSALLMLLSLASLGAAHESPNFRVEAPTEDIARQVAAAAEHYRIRLAERWYGKRLPNWGAPCEVTVRIGKNLGAGGATKFKFSAGQVYGWKMDVQGSLERILDSVIPHEVNHTILACYFRRKVPRWADEGAATMIEHDSERQRQIDLARQLVDQGRRIPLRVLFQMTKYPSDMNQVLAMYAQGYSLTEFLVQKGGRRHFLRFLEDAHHRGWDAAINDFYGSRNIEALERDWSSWVITGSPRLDLPKGQLLVVARPPSVPVPIVRSQSPDTATSTPTTGNDRPASRSPVARLASGLKESWQTTAATFSRVRQFGRSMTAPSPQPRPENFEPHFEPGIIAALNRTSLQPLELTPINARKSGSTDASSNAQPLKLQRVTQEERPDLREPVLRQLRPNRLTETRLRKEELPAPAGDQYLDWTAFPNKIER